MNFACFVSFMIFHFVLNLAFHTNICPVRTLILIYLILKKKKLENVCQPASPGGTFFKTKPRNLPFLI